MHNHFFHSLLPLLSSCILLNIYVYICIYLFIYSAVYTMLKKLSVLKEEKIILDYRSTNFIQFHRTVYRRGACILFLSLSVFED